MRGNRLFRVTNLSVSRPSPDIPCRSLSDVSPLPHNVTTLYIAPSLPRRPPPRALAKDIQQRCSPSVCREDLKDGEVVT